jgi:hypothetical protein
MRHFVEKRVDAFRPIRLEHQVDVQRDLDHKSSTFPSTRQHVAQRRLHSTAQAYRDVGRKNPTEACMVEIVIDRPDVTSLVGCRTAVSHASVGTS